MANPINSIPRRSARASALALLSCTALACHTAGATSSTTAAAAVAASETGTASLPVKTSERPPARVSTESSESRPAPALADEVPCVLVTPSGNAYLVLRAGPARHDPALTWDVLYLAGHDAGELARPDAQDRLAVVARELVAAFAPMAEIGHIERLSITAMFGKPDAAGRVERLWFTRDAAGWHAAVAAGERGVTHVPPVQIALSRDPGEEASARDVAAEFISDVDRDDYDAAWARTSALAKAIVSRADFERTLEQLPDPDRDRDGDLYLTFVAAQRFLPGANMIAWVARETAVGRIVEMLSLRLDDDMTWRVADVAGLAAAPAPSAVVRRPAAEIGNTL
jgi:hypothetical protein